MLENCSVSRRLLASLPLLYYLVHWYESIHRSNTRNTFPPSQEDDTSIDIESQPDNPAPTANTSNIPPPTIEITSLEDGQEVPVGELTIEGISSDNAESDCQVYANLNYITPMRNATAVANAAEDNDFSKWTFTYSRDYQLIKQDENQLTVKSNMFRWRRV